MPAGRAKSPAAGAPPRASRRTRGRGAPRPVTWIVAAAPLAGIAWSLVGTPAVVVVAALVPALGYLLLLAALAGIPKPGVRPVLLFAAVWGAGGAVLASAPVNDLLQIGFGGGGWPLTLVGVPLVEEATKAGVLLGAVLLCPTELRGARAGIVAGALVGWGFALTENVQYFLVSAVQGGRSGLLAATWVRGFLEGPVHPVFAACTGAGLGIDRAVARATARPRALLVGFAAAVVQHALWNGVAARAVTGILCNGVDVAGACRGNPGALLLVVAVPLVVTTALGPGLLGLGLLIRRPATG